MLAAFSKAIGQLSDPRILRVLGGSVLLCVLCFAVVWLSVGWILTDVRFFESGWLDATLAVSIGLATLALTWFLFPVLVMAFIVLFLDYIARAVEARHYPYLPKAPGITFWQGLIAIVRFLGLALAINLLLLLLLFFPPAYPVGYLVGNGFLISREYFDLVALRRMQPDEARALRSRYTGEMLLFGIATAFLITIPFVNFVAPVVATAAMVHRFESWRGLPPPGSMGVPPPPPPSPPADTR